MLVLLASGYSEFASEGQKFRPKIIRKKALSVSELERDKINTFFSLLISHENCFRRGKWNNLCTWMHTMSIRPEIRNTFDIYMQFLFTRGIRIIILELFFLLRNANLSTTKYNLYFYPCWFYSSVIWSVKHGKSTISLVVWNICRN